MRLVGWSVQPIVMSDDGEFLVQVPTGVMQVPASAWQAFKDGGDVTNLEALRLQIEGPPAPPPDPGASQ